jgi:hypothetical protein
MSDKVLTYDTFYVVIGDCCHDNGAYLSSISLGHKVAEDEMQAAAREHEGSFQPAHHIDWRSRDGNPWGWLRCKDCDDKWCIDCGSIAKEVSVEGDKK